jgi:hypothetical protein
VLSGEVEVVNTGGRCRAIVLKMFTTVTEIF